MNLDQSSQEKERIHIMVSGRVQGVGFRAFVQRTANELGLSGWVRNVGPNQVETIAEGNPQVLKSFLEAVFTGPRGSRINESNFHWEIPIGDLTSFEIRFR